MLRQTGTAAGAALSLAGCLQRDSAEDDPSDEGGPSTGGDDVSTPNRDFDRWLPAPAAFDTDGYAFLTMAPAAVVEHEDELGAGATEGIDDELTIPGIETLADATAVHRVGRSTTVLEADVDRSEVESEFATRGIEQSGTHGGYAIYGGSEPPAFAVADGALVVGRAYSSSDESDKRPVVRSVVDARTGDGRRYAAAAEDAAALLDALGAGHVVQGRTHEPGETFERGVAEGAAVAIGESETAVRAVAVFTDDHVDASALSDWATDAALFHGADPETATEGRTVVASATVPTGDVATLTDEFPGPPIERSSPANVPPQVLFDFEYESTGDGVGLLRITHEGGDSVRASALTIEGGPFASVSEADQTSAGTWSGSTNEDGAVTAGHSVAVGVESGYDVRVVWKQDGESVTLGGHEGLES